MTPLQQLVVDRLAELNLSYRAAQDRAGKLVTHSTINNIAMGRTQWDGIPNKTLRGLALALDLPYSQIEQAWKDSCAAPPTEFRLPKKADKLTPSQRKAVLAFVNALLDGQPPQ